MNNFHDITRRLLARAAQTSDGQVQGAVTTLSDEATREAERTAGAAASAAAAALAAHTGRTDNPHAVTAAQVGAEPALGNPGTSGYVLSSTAAGVRSWVAQVSSLAWSAITGKPTTLAGYGITDAAPLSHTTNTSNPHSTTAAQVGAEPALGNPGTSGYVLSSTAAGVRSWVAQVSSLAWSAITGKPTTLAGYGITDAAPLSHTTNTSNPHSTTAAQVGAAPAIHAHAAGDITSGILAVARGGTGVGVQPVFSLARGSSSAAIVSGTITKVLWTHEVADATGVADLANSRVTPSTGNWLFVVSLTWNAMTPPAGMYFQILIYKNGAFYYAPPSLFPPAAAGNHGQLVPFLIPGADGTDYYEVYTRQTSGANQTLYGDSGLTSTSWSGVRL